MDDVFDVLTEDHEDVRQMLSELEKGPTAGTGATEDQLMLRKIMTEELIIETAKHEEIELTCFWPAVRAHVPGGEAFADRAICAEIEISGILVELDKLDASEPEFENLLSQFTKAAREHFDFEEGHVWPRLRSALTAKAAAELGRKVLLGKQAVPVPPPSRASAWPGGNARHGSFG